LIQVKEKECTVLRANGLPTLAITWDFGHQECRQLGSYRLWHPKEEKKIKFCDLLVWQRFTSEYR
jgi:hypothetical protein